MDMKAATRLPGNSVFDRIEKESYAKKEVCRYWLAGSCNKYQCSFLHPQSQTPHPNKSKSWRNPNYNMPKHAPVNPHKDLTKKQGSKFDWKNPNYNTPKPAPVNPQKDHTKKPGSEFDSKTVKNPQKQVCKYWITGNCVYGDKCKNFHSWFYGDGFTMVAKLEGHTKAVTGIALPSGSNKLYSASEDKTLLVWDCHSGQCDGMIEFDSGCGTLISEGACIFVGLSNAVKAWNLQAQGELTLNGPIGQVYALHVGNDMLFAGIKDGTILVWRTSSSEVAATLKGHRSAVLSLVVGSNRLYSGSTDRTIRVWDIEKLECLQTLHGHSDIVMSMICWDSFLLSGSLDNQIKVWAASESGKLEVVYEHDEEHGVLGLCGITDAEAKPILLCSRNDNSVCLYDLPSFNERGRIFAKGEIRSLQIGTGGLFFTGDATGQVTVWKLNEKTSQ